MEDKGSGIGQGEGRSAHLKEIEGIEIIPDITASLIMGQPDFNCCKINRGAATAQNNSFNQPSGICGKGGGIFVADSCNNRVLLWNRVDNDRTADIVLGQATFNENLENRGRDYIRIRNDWLVGSEDWYEDRKIARPDADTLSCPTGICVTDKMLFIADTNNHRILLWETIPAHNGMAADRVIGQPDFVSWSANRDGNLGAGSLFFPAGVFSDGVRLFVADKDNHRVLIWNRIPDSNGMEADLVLGHPDFKSRMQNRGHDKAGPDTLSFPTGIFYDGSHLFVVDQGNHRVLIWDHLPRRDGEPADIVLGQKDFAGRAENRGCKCGASSLSFPTQAFSRGADLYIVDQGNNRVLIWKGFSWMEKGGADIVIGQPDLEANEHRWRLVKIEDESGNPSIEMQFADSPNSYTLWEPSMLWVDDQERVFILDRSNNRVVVWNKLPLQEVGKYGEGI